MSDSAFLKALAMELAPIIAEIVVTKLREDIGSSVPRYATTSSNPLGSRSAFLSAHRAGAFKTWRHGRELAAKWSDVEAYAMSRRPRTEAPTPSDVADDLALAATPRRKAKKAA